jgi:hypothetical protein
MNALVQQGLLTTPHSQDLGQAALKLRHARDAVMLPPTRFSSTAINKTGMTKRHSTRRWPKEDMFLLVLLMWTSANRTLVEAGDVTLSRRWTTANDGLVKGKVVSVFFIMTI